MFFTVIWYVKSHFQINTVNCAFYLFYSHYIEDILNNSDLWTLHISKTSFSNFLCVTKPVPRPSNSVDDSFVQSNVLFAGYIWAYIRVCYYSYGIGCIVSLYLLIFVFGKSSAISHDKAFTTSKSFISYNSYIGDNHKSNLRLMLVGYDLSGSSKTFLDDEIQFNLIFNVL